MESLKIHDTLEEAVADLQEFGCIDADTPAPSRPQAWRRFLFQLPRHFGKDTKRLRDFFHMLPRCYRYAFEFREEAWYSADVFELLHDFDIALCISDHADAPAPWEATASHVYLRGHGPSGRYQGSYSVTILRRWAEATLRWQSEGRAVFVYFDNDQKAAAPCDARRLLRIIRQ